MPGVMDALSSAARKLDALINPKGGGEAAWALLVNHTNRPRLAADTQHHVALLAFA